MNNRTLVDKYIKLSEQQTLAETKDYYWDFAEKLDNIYAIMERAIGLDDRKMVIRCCEKVLAYGELGKEKEALEWIEKTIDTNKKYDILRKTKNL